MLKKLPQKKSAQSAEKENECEGCSIKSLTDLISTHELTLEMD